MALALVMVVSMAGCGDTKQPVQRGESSTTGPAATSAGSDTGKNTQSKSDPIELVVYSQLANYSGE